MSLDLFQQTAADIECHSKWSHWPHGHGQGCQRCQRWAVEYYASVDEDQPVYTVEGSVMELSVHLEQAALAVVELPSPASQWGTVEGYVYGPKPSGPPPAWVDEWDNEDDALYDLDPHDE